MDKRHSVIIVGAGVAGLAAAAALLPKVSDLLILEKRDSIEDGTGITLTTNGIAALNYILSECLKLEVKNQSYAMVDNSGLTKFHYEFTMVTLLRRELVCKLRERIPEDRIRYRVAVVKLEEVEDEVLVHLSNGGCLRAASVLCADGANSSLRSHVCLPPPTISFPSWRGIVVDCSKWPDERLAGYVIEGCGFQMLIARFSSGGSIYWALYSAHPHEFLTKDSLASHLADWWSFVPEIISMSSTFVATKVAFFHKPLDKWFSRRLLLVGDALHPIPPQLGQGANVALEDAAVLRSLINNNSLTDCFEEFRRKREHRIHRILQSSVLLTPMFKEAQYNDDFSFIYNFDM